MYDRKYKFSEIWTGAEYVGLSESEYHSYEETWAVATERNLEKIQGPVVRKPINLI